MFKLIMADLKVLGNRIWQIPLGVLLVTVIAGLVLREISNSVMFINAAIVPVIFVVLSYSLMYYSENSKLQNEIGSLPCSTNMLVFEKYFMVLIFLGISYLSNTIFLALASLFHDFNFNDVFTVFNITIMMILTMSMLAIPLFFKYRSAKTAYFGTFIWVAGLGTIFGTILVKLYPFNEDIHKNIFILIALFILSMSAMAIIYLKDRRTGAAWNKLLLFPIVSILPVTAFSTILTVMDIINHALLYNLMLPGYKRMFIYSQAPDYLANAYRIDQLHVQISSLLLNGTISMILLAALIYLMRKYDIKKSLSNIAFFLFVPLVLLSLVIALFLLIYTVEIILSGNNVRISLDTAYLIAFYGSFLPLFLVSFRYSKKFLTEGGK